MNFLLSSENMSVLGRPLLVTEQIRSPDIALSSPGQLISLGSPNGYNPGQVHCFNAHERRTQQVTAELEQSFSGVRISFSRR